MGLSRAIVATLMPSWEYNGKTLGLSLAILGPPLGSWGVLGLTLGFRVYGVRFDHKSDYLFEMPKSLSPYVCAAKTPA